MVGEIAMLATAPTSSLFMIRKRLCEFYFIPRTVIHADVTAPPRLAHDLLRQADAGIPTVRLRRGVVRTHDSYSDSPVPFGLLVCNTTRMYSGVGADIVMESISPTTWFLGCKAE
jgi:hypothetical protein